MTPRLTASLVSLLVLCGAQPGCKKEAAAPVPPARLAPYQAAKIDWGAARGQPLVLAMNQHMETDALKKQLPVFRALTGIEVRIESYPENELHQKSLVDLSSRQGAFDV